MMKWASILSEERASEAAAEDAAAQLRSALGASPDLVTLFASGHHAQRYDSVLDLLAREFPSATLIGCSGLSVIGGGHELEACPGVALAGATLPGVDIHSFALDADSLPGPDADSASWHDQVGIDAQGKPQFVLLADPFRFPTEHLIRGMDLAYPSAVKVGGLASGGEPGQIALWLGAEQRRSGLVGLALSGNVTIDPVVAQGCRPIGSPLFVTHCHDNLLQRVDGQPAIEILEQLFESASPADQKLFRSSLFLGIEMEAGQGEYGPGDFLIRNIIGIDPDQGSLAVAAPLQPAQVVQFHVRDAVASAEDLDRCLSRYSSDLGRSKPRGALLFSCLGRGVGLYGTSDHDSSAFRSRVGDVPLAGFFGNGEIGPVQRRTFLHGYTSAFAIFRECDPRRAAAQPERIRPTRPG